MLMTFDCGFGLDVNDGQKNYESNGKNKNLSKNTFF